MVDDSAIATHSEPVGRSRSNSILLLSLAVDGLPGRYEQMRTRTDDKIQFELCRIPFFTYDLSLGDVVRLTGEDGQYRVESKGGHRTIRFAIQDQAFRHQRHEEFHGALAATGTLMELRGHALGYGAIDIVSQDQADAVIDVLLPLAANETLMWEWADPVVPD